MVGFTTVTILSLTFRSLGKQTWGVSYRGNCLSSFFVSGEISSSDFKHFGVSLFLTWNDGFIKKICALPEFHQPELLIQKKNSLHFLLSIADIMEVNVCQADDRELRETKTPTRRLVAEPDWFLVLGCPETITHTGVEQYQPLLILSMWPVLSANYYS